MQKITNSYNATIHYSLGKAPKDITKSDEYDIWQKNYAPKDEILKQKRVKSILNGKKEQFTFSINDVVKISNLRGAFDKEYQSRWTNETFRIIDRKIKQGVAVYYLKDQLQETIQGSFYSNELQKVVVDENEEYEIEKIIRKRKRNKNNEVLVKWRGFPSKFNSWTLESSVNKYSD